jgi:hypothetical protein
MAEFTNDPLGRVDARLAVGDVAGKPEMALAEVGGGFPGLAFENRKLGTQLL